MTAGSASLPEPTLLPTPLASDAKGPRPVSDYSDLRNSLTLLPTPVASVAGGTPEQHLARKQHGAMNRANPTVTDLRMVCQLLPTPTASDADSTRTRYYPTTQTHHCGTTLTDAVVPQLLPTPTASDGNGPGHHGTGSPDLRTTVATDTGVDWDKYQPAIQRWTAITQQPAPDPLTPERRLSAVFVEWMMGYPPGRITNHQLTNRQALRLLGNAVVPQQLANALNQLGGLAHHD